MKILVINGPNLNLLGKRETHIYGKMTLAKLEQSIINYGKDHGISIHCMQSNLEGELIDVLQNAKHRYDGIILNAGGYTHTSVALRDAASTVSLPIIEVHISNPAAREPFRHTSLLSSVCVGTISGFKEYSYFLAVEFFRMKYFRKNRVYKKI